MTDAVPAIDLSVVAPAHGERENLAPFVEELDGTLATLGRSCELIIVDDASTDGSAAELRRLQSVFPSLRVLTLPARSRGRPHGQSAAYWAAFRVARGEVVAILDADLQNHPDDLRLLLEELERTGADLVQGDRSAVRADSLVRRVSSRVGRLTRRLLLGDTIRDTGCSLRVMRRQVARSLPLEFTGMHRFIPLTARQMGLTVVEVPVRHRPRRAGRTKYGIWNRALPGLLDCLAVRWMARRRRTITWVEHEAPAGPTRPRREPTRAGAAP
jgi:glycosyltransferase involved in cell wall biosynthesis